MIGAFIKKVLGLNPWVLLAAVLAILGVLGGFYGKGRYDEAKSCKSAETKSQEKRANDAETQRDIANAPPASVDAMLDWLSGTPNGR